MKTRRFVFWLILIFITFGMIVLFECLVINDVYSAVDSIDPIFQPEFLFVIILPLGILLGASLFYLFYSKRKREQLVQTEILSEVLAYEN